MERVWNVLSIPPFCHCFAIVFLGLPDFLPSLPSFSQVGLLQNLKFGMHLVNKRHLGMDFVWKSQFQTSNPRTDIECPLGKYEREWKISNSVQHMHIYAWAFTRKSQFQMPRGHSLGNLILGMRRGYAWENSIFETTAAVTKSHFQSYIPNGISEISFLLISSTFMKPSSALSRMPMKYLDTVSLVSVNPLFLSAL